MAHDEDFESPAWADILAKGSLEFDKLTPAQLQAEYAIRIPALLESCGAENTFEGWRDVAIKEAIRLHPAFKVQKRQRLPVSGRPISDRRWFWRQRVFARVRKLEAKAKHKGVKLTRLRAEAARQVHAEYFAKETVARARMRGQDTRRVLVTPSAKTLQHYLTRKIPFPNILKRNDYRLDAYTAALKAARKLPT